MSSAAFNAKFSASNKKSSCSPVAVFSWATILLWVGFLAYCVHYGFITSDQISGMVENAEQLERKALRSVADLARRGESAADSVLHGGLTNPGSAANVPANENIDHSQDVYVVFSTDCTPYQDWQSLVLFHSAKLAKQKGVVTRIASGCNEEKKVQLSKLYHDLHGDFSTVHFTPDYKRDAKTNKSYNFYNKPWGIKHWLEFGNVPDHAVIALLDPDMVFLRPIVPQIRSMPYLISKRTPESEVIDTIRAGFPVAQTYGLGAPWAREQHRHFNKYKICGKDSPCVKISENFAEMHYSVGPPYVMVKEDFVRVAKSWTTLVPKVYEDYPYLLAEMYAYSMGSAHEELPHLQLENYMVSNVDSPGEGWPWVDSLPAVCVPPENDIYYPGEKLPTVAHFCQTYRIGEYIFTKHRVPQDIFDCKHPMLTEIPPSVIDSKYYLKKQKKEEFKNARAAKRHAFMVCVLYDAVNKALAHYKAKMCSGGDSAPNTEKTFAMHG